MRAEGYEEGRDYVLEQRYAEGRNEQLLDLATELVRLPVDVMLAAGTPPTTAAKSATQTIPIVMTSVGSDPVALGLVESLAWPGGNVTGTANLNVALGGKRMDLLKGIVPSLIRLAVLQDLANPTNVLTIDGDQPAAQTLGIQLQNLPFSSVNDLVPAFETATRQQADALKVPGSSFFQINRELIVELAAIYHLPAVYEQREFAAAGGLMAYAANQSASFRTVATYVAKILKGAKPADLPVEQAATFDFVINLRTAQALGLTIPQSVLAQATEVIQ
jgi:putative ABC transport system substrate-binding protein